jgi:hypothetical protein
MWFYIYVLVSQVWRYNTITISWAIKKGCASAKEGVVSAFKSGRRFNVHFDD